MTNEREFLSQDSLCRDITLKWQDVIIRGRLAISPELQRSWVDHFAKSPEKGALAAKFDSAASITLNVEVGQTSLTIADLDGSQ